MSFQELMNDLAIVKNDAIKLTKNISGNDDKIIYLVENSKDLLECSLDACRNPNREVQLPITKIYTERIKSEEGDELMKKVIDKFKEYKKTFEESCSTVSDLVIKSRQLFGTLTDPVAKIRDETDTCYKKYKETIDNLARPLSNIVDGFEIDEFRKKNFKDSEVLKKFKSLLEDLKKTFNQYNESLTTFNTETVEIFEKVTITNNQFSNLIEEKLLQNIRNIPIFLNNGISLLPEVAKDINSCNKTGDDRIKFYDSCLARVLNATKEVDNNGYEANKNIEENLKDMNSKVVGIKNDIEERGKTYASYTKELKELGQKIIDIVDEIRKLFDKDKMKMKQEMKDIEYPFYEYAKKLQAGYEKLEEVKEEVKQPLKLIMVVTGKTINMVTIDLLFIMDITISMQDLLDETRNSIKYIVDKIKKDSPGIDIRFAYEGYRDFADLKEGEKYYTIDFTTDVNSFKAELDKITALGGGDDAEDVAGGLDEGLNCSWRSNARYAILIADAPGHGKQYHDREVQDDYPNGDPKGRTLEGLIGEYVKKNINLCVSRIAEYTDIMFGVFDKVYKEKTKGKNNCNFQIIDYDEDGGNQMGDIVAKTAIEIYNKYCKGNTSLG